MLLLPVAGAIVAGVMLLDDDVLACEGTESDDDDMDTEEKLESEDGLPSGEYCCCCCCCCCCWLFINVENPLRLLLLLLLLLFMLLLLLSFEWLLYGLPGRELLLTLLLLLLLLLLKEELVGESGPEDVSVKLIMWKVKGLSLLALDRRLTGGLARV